MDSTSTRQVDALDLAVLLRDHNVTALQARHLPLAVWKMYAASVDMTINPHMAYEAIRLLEEIERLAATPVDHLVDSDTTPCDYCDKRIPEDDLHRPWFDDNPDEFGYAHPECCPGCADC